MHRYTKMRAMQGSRGIFQGFSSEVGPGRMPPSSEPDASVEPSCTVEPVPVIHVADPDDPRLADYVGLADPQLRRRVEAERGFFIAESPLVVRALMRSSRAPRSVLVTPAQHAALADVLDAAAVPVFVAEADVLRRVVGFDLHRGAVASANAGRCRRWRRCSTAPAGSAVVEQINDYENLGGIFRSAAAFGIDAVLLDAESADPLYRRCVRVSIGHVLSVPWTRVHSLDELASRGFTLLALTPDPDAAPIGEIVWPERCALLFGAEGPGLSDAWLAAADRRVRIPMRAAVDSLNVATAAAIAFYAGT